MATLHFISGKAGAGKTTLARQIARTAPAVLICEDEWMSRLADPIGDLQQYLAAAAKIRSIVAPLSVDLLKLGASVVFRLRWEHNPGPTVGPIDLRERGSRPSSPLCCG